ncbi:hypothetical protein QWZ04_16025 [Vibrio tapetis subsp. quintayensis]|uniref:hypothetical protein n=1 Tax=Vibrio tapetis TaxID=52443 RepID=UPI0025B51BD1|nr:hypothetical protein [Vibrio tapetis]MDN3681813.1 hypothetical protein [Vibrio tapetis subsp. quintayensis]
MDKAQIVIENELEQLKARVESDSYNVLPMAQQCLLRAEQILYHEGEIQAHIVIARCYWSQMDYRKGMKSIKLAHTIQSREDNDNYLPEILHVHALQYWGQAKYYSAQQFWINALEQSALVGESTIEIESLIGLGNVWRITGDVHLAKSTHELAVKVANNARIDWLEGKARILLSWDYYLLNNYVEMLSVLDGAEEALKYHQDPTWRAEILDFRGLALIGLERLEDAEAATLEAHTLAVENDLKWMKAHSFISRARLELIRKNFDSASDILKKAEEAAKPFDNGELLSQICFQQSVVAEESQDFELALQAFKKYRRYSIIMQKEQTNRIGMDKARGSKRQLEQRARKLINRIRGYMEFNREKRFSNAVSETYWWEQLVLYKSELKKSNHAVIIIRHPDNNFLEVSIELAHCFCGRDDLISQLDQERLGMIISEKDEGARRVFDILQQMMTSYPWERKGLKGDAPALSLHDILTFPYTIDQLDDQPLELGNGSTTK